LAIEYKSSPKIEGSIQVAPVVKREGGESGKSSADPKIFIVRESSDRIAMQVPGQIQICGFGRGLWSGTHTRKVFNPISGDKGLYSEPDRGYRAPGKKKRDRQTYALK